MLLLIDEVVSKVHWGTQGYKRAKAFKSYRGTIIGLAVQTAAGISSLASEEIDQSKGGGFVAEAPLSLPPKVSMRELLLWDS